MLRHRLKIELEVQCQVFCPVSMYAGSASHAAPWRVTVSMPTGQTDRRTDARPLHLLSARHGMQTNKYGDR